ncbi:MAG: IS110 family transposase [Candidatus Undinarchaeales archaeon]|jgi:transposase|nr:IS110 family transposase [Candidatus Undinarchaeales archaeon]MDP7491957.1 IS110 family transposase [Candidatus Undinarchaeales archaeon]
MEQLYGAMDIHKETLRGIVRHGDGTIEREKTIPYTRKAIEKFFEGIPSPSLTIAIEACGLWRGVYRILKDMGYEVALANPLKVRRIADARSTDKVDARLLSELLSKNFLPRVYIPDEEILMLRDLTRHRARMVRQQTSLKSRIKAFLAMDGNIFRITWNKKDLEHLKSLDPKIANLVHILEAIEGEIKPVKKEIDIIARTNYRAGLLQTVPGIGSFGSLMILGEIGDIRRFKRPKSLVSYAGLCRGIKQSGNTSHSVRIKACNKWLKWIMYQCSGRAIMKDDRYTGHFSRVNRRNDYKTARRSIARKMLTDVWHMLTKEEPFRPS